MLVGERIRALREHIGYSFTERISATPPRLLK